MEKEKIINLVKAVQAGEQNAYGQLYEATYQDIYYFILKTVKEKVLAEDLTQDTFIRIMENISQLQEPEAFVGWSRQIAYHGCTAYFRKRKELLVDENEDGGTVFDTVTEENAEFIPHEALDQEDLKKTILDMIDSLPREQKTALLLRYYDELSVAQIAKIQGVSEGTVKSRLNYGRNAVRKSVEAYEKKNGIKLHSFAILPLLLWLLRKKKLVEGKSITAGASTGVATGAAVGGKAAAGAASKGFFSTIGGKIAAAVLAVAVVGGGVAAVASVGTKNSQPQQTHEQTYQQTDAVLVPGQKNILCDLSFEEEALCVGVCRIIFTNKAVPQGVTTYDMSRYADGSVLAWKEPTTSAVEGAQMYDVYVTTADGGTLYAPVYCDKLFENFRCEDYETPAKPGQKGYLTQIIFENFDLTYTQSLNEMFLNLSLLTELDVSDWNTSNVVRAETLFFNCRNLQSVDVSRWDTSSMESISHMFAYCEKLQNPDVSGWDTSNVQNMSGTFTGCKSITSVDVSGWDTSKVTNMGSMFSDCLQLTNLDVSGWDTSNVEDMFSMFGACTALSELDVSGWDTSKVTNMRAMFAGCKMTQLAAGDWNTANVTDMNCMFYGCDKLVSLDLSGWDTSKVTDMGFMFGYCENLTSLNLNGWNLSNVKIISDIFYCCINLSSLDLTGWDISNAEESYMMFHACNKLPDSIKNQWN